jgi:hypothetical protein
MGKISTYAVDSTPSLSDKLIGTEVGNLNATKNYTIGQILSLLSEAILTLPIYETNDEALFGGLTEGQLFRDTPGIVHIVFN